MNLTFERKGPKIRKPLLTKLEKALGCKLPADYREFLLENNGGKPSKPYFFASEDDVPDDPDWIDDFHFVDEHLAEPNPDAPTFSLSYQDHQWGRYIPDHFLIIATVVRDDKLLLRINGKRRGEVALKVFDFEELGDDWVASKKRGIHHLADSFTEFLEMLLPRDDFD